MPYVSVIHMHAPDIVLISDLQLEVHPGDIRPVKAVDREHLRHLKNVIVFSTKGDRPLPNM